MIFINGRFLEQSTTGVQRFAFEISWHLQKIRKDVFFIVSKKSKLKSKLTFLNNIIEVGESTGFFWEQVELPRYLREKETPLLLNLCNRGPLFYNNNLVVLHDITFKRYPKSVSLAFGLFYNLTTPILIKKAKKVFTVSDFSKKEILDVYPNINRNISVIYNAVDEKFKPGVLSIKPESYFFAVSSDYLHKNFERLVQAFLLLGDDSIKLKIAGRPGAISSKYQNIPNIEFLGRVSDEQLINLYQNAIAFVFPSLYEGFGIPPLEAQACGCPVISSNAASLSEVLGESACYFNPLDINEIKNSLRLVLSDEKLRLCLKEKGFSNLSRFSWSDSARQLSDVIDTIA